MSKCRTRNKPTPCIYTVQDPRPCQHLGQRINSRYQKLFNHGRCDASDLLTTLQTLNLTSTHPVGPLRLVARRPVVQPRVLVLCHRLSQVLMYKKIGSLSLSPPIHTNIYIYVYMYKYTYTICIGMYVYLSTIRLRKRSDRHIWFRSY